MKNVVVLLSFGVLSLGYLIYVPVPPDFLNPWRGRILTSTLDALETMASITSTVTGTPMTEYMHRWSKYMRRTYPHNFTDIEVTPTEIVGLRSKIYRRKGVQGSIPAVVFFHGGGWVMGDIDGYEGFNIRLAAMTNTTIIAVNYRKAPAHPYPTPFLDCLQATHYVLTHGDELGVDSKQVFVAGDSAGGNLAAAVALKLSSEDPSVVPRLKGQLLLSPVVQAMTFNTPSYRDSPGIILTQERMILFWTAYLGIPFNRKTLSAMLNDRHVSTALQKSRHGSYAGKGQSVEVKDEYDVTLAKTLDKLIVDPFLAPLMADDKMLRATPPALVVAAEYEQLRDEIALYADRLKRSGVSTDFRLLKGQTHLTLPLVGSPPHVMYTEDLQQVVVDVAEYIVKIIRVEH